MSRTVATQPAAAPAEPSPPDGDRDNSEDNIGTSPRLYLSVQWKFVLSLTFALMWLGLSTWISLPWIASLAQVISLGPAVLVVSLLAFVPGLIIAFLVAGLTLLTGLGSLEAPYLGSEDGA